MTVTCKQVTGLWTKFHCLNQRPYIVLLIRKNKDKTNDLQKD